MATNSVTKEIKQISQMKKDVLLRSLASASKTRKKVRENIKNDTLPSIPKEINSFLDDSAA